MKSVYIIILLGVFVALLSGVWFYLPKEEPVFCTQEAKLCSDGTAVGRTGPNCEFAACPGEDGNGGDGGLFKTTGTVAGRVTIGPLCPVEREGVPCGPADVYSSRKIILNPKGGGRPIDLPFYININPDGIFSAEIPEGNYELTITDCGFMGCSYEFPKAIRVDMGKTLDLNIDIDTGIR